MCGIEPLTTMRSDRLRAESDEILDPERIISRQLSWRDPKSLKINYHDNRYDVSPLFAKRGFEIYSPLNEKRIILRLQQTGGLYFAGRRGSCHKIPYQNGRFSEENTVVWRS